MDSFLVIFSKLGQKLCFFALFYTKKSLSPSDPQHWPNVHCKVWKRSPAIYQSLSEWFDIFPEKRRSVGVRILNVNEENKFDPQEAAALLNKELICGNYSNQKESGTLRIFISNNCI